MNEQLNFKNYFIYGKIQWLILHDSIAWKTELEGKYLVRKWITEKIGDRYLIPIIGVWNGFEDIDFSRVAV